MAPLLVGGVELVVEGVELGAGTAELLAAGLAVLPVVVEPLPPPQPPSRAAPANATVSQVSGLGVMGPSSIAGTLARQCRELWRPSDLQAYIA
jgi:hypothetical protein